METKQTISGVLQRPIQDKPKKDVFKTVSAVVFGVLTIPVLFAAITSIAFVDDKSQYTEKLKLDEQNYAATLKLLEGQRCALASTKLLAYANDALTLDSAEVARLSDLKASCGGF